MDERRPCRNEIEEPIPNVALPASHARPLLLNFGQHGDIDIGGWADRVWRIDARCNGPWELPALGAVPVPTAVLVRPDGYGAWVYRTASRLNSAVNR